MTDMTAAELDRLTDASKGYCSKLIKRSRIDVGLDLASRIADVFGVSLDALAGRVEFEPHEATVLRCVSKARELKSSSNIVRESRRRKRKKAA